MPDLSRRELFSLAALPAAAPARPNILLLLGDNWAAPHASIYGDPVVRTPVFDRLAAEGALFTHAFAANPSCAPSRSSLLTGLVTHRLGEAASLYGPLASQFAVYPDLLEKAGYRVGFSGKGWGPGIAVGRSRNPAGAPFPDLAGFLEKTDPARPFCFWFGSHDPHLPWDRGRDFKNAMDARKVQPPHTCPTTLPSATTS